MSFAHSVVQLCDSDIYHLKPSNMSSSACVQVLVTRPPFSLLLKAAQPCRARNAAATASHFHFTPNRKRAGKWKANNVTQLFVTGLSLTAWE